MKLIAIFVTCVSLGAAALHAQTSATLTLQQTIPLPGIQGKFDHFALDPIHNRLFAAAGGSQSVEVIDLATGQTIDSLKNFGKPHGIVWIASTGRLFVTDGKKAELAVYMGWPLKRVKSIPLSEDADDMVYDDASNLLYIGHGGTDAANPPRIAVVDAGTLMLLKDIPVAAHPEALELDPAGDRIFANIADAGQIVAVDGRTQTIAATRSLKRETGNTPLAYDATNNLLLVGCRTPAKLLVLNADTGEEISSAVTSTGSDDLFYDASNHRVYLIAGAGAVDSFAVSPDGKLQPAGVTHTVAGAKTGFLRSAKHLLYVGIPGNTEPAAIRVYKTSVQ